MAGYFDGEASFMYTRTPVIDVASVYPYTLRLFSERFGGTVTPRRVSRDSVRDYYQWRVHGNKAIAALNAALPYLREKKAQALLVLEIRQTPPGTTRDGLIAQLKGFKKLEYKHGT
tara:strand:+ start:3326 stop:3673 length:348 start_codon:yes stop_codon:yes gene_type:complete